MLSTLKVVSASCREDKYQQISPLPKDLKFCYISAAKPVFPAAQRAGEWCQVGLMELDTTAGKQENTLCFTRRWAPLARLSYFAFSWRFGKLKQGCFGAGLGSSWEAHTSVSESKQLILKSMVKYT